MTEPTAVPDRPIVETMRRFLAVAFVVGGVGTLAELFLLEHTEDYWQWTPLILIGLSIVAFAALGARPTKSVLRVTQALMVLVLLSGGLGVFFHFKGNIEFEKEMYPSMAGVELIWESLKGATPSLAPGAMVLLGLVGLIYCFRHPAVGPSGR